MESENHFQTQTKANRYVIYKAMFVLQTVSKSVYYAFDCWERDPEERLSYNER